MLNEVDVFSTTGTFVLRLFVRIEILASLMKAGTRKGCPYKDGLEALSFLWDFRDKKVQMTVMTAVITPPTTYHLAVVCTTGAEADSSDV